MIDSQDAVNPEVVYKSAIPPILLRTRSLIITSIAVYSGFSVTSPTMTLRTDTSIAVALSHKKYQKRNAMKFLMERRKQRIANAKQMLLQLEQADLTGQVGSFQDESDALSMMSDSIHEKDDHDEDDAETDSSIDLDDSREKFEPEQTLRWAHRRDVYKGRSYPGFGTTALLSEENGSSSLAIERSLFEGREKSKSCPDNKWSRSRAVQKLASWRHDPEEVNDMCLVEDEARGNCRMRLEVENMLKEEREKEPKLYTSCSEPAESSSEMSDLEDSGRPRGFYSIDRDRLVQNAMWNCN